MDIHALFSENPGEKRTLAYVYDGSADEFLSLAEKNKDIADVVRKLGNFTNRPRIAVGLKMDINKTITGQIIHYKDSLKLPNPALKIPYFLYGNNGKHDYGIILYPPAPGGYLYAKALYYLITEREALYDGHMNRILSLYADPEHTDEIAAAIRELAEGRASCGRLQRTFDAYYFRTPDEMQELCVKEAQRIVDYTQENLKTSVYNKNRVIQDAVRSWFLLKRLSYVYYMRYRNAAAGEQDRNYRDHRREAKRRADQIPYIPYSVMWRMYGDEPGNGKSLAPEGQ